MYTRLKMISFMAHLASVGLLLAVPVQSQCFNQPATFSPLLSTVPSQVQFISCSTAFDSPKVEPINATTFDWWYFDAVSSDAKEALTVVFFTSSNAGFTLDAASLVTPVNVYVFANFADGTTLPMLPIAATSATVTTNGNGASGTWAGTGASFQGASDLSTYTITFNNPVLDIEGTVTLKSKGPGHFSCGPLQGGVDEQLLPHVGWVNVLPAADATVDMILTGKELNFTGHGYHDKNWGDKPFFSTIQSWYWGHGTFGPYDLVWFDAIDSTGKEWVSGYALQNGQVVGSNCNNLQVRPVSAAYPPTIAASSDTQYTIKMTLDNGTPLNAVITAKATQISLDIYSRWIGSITGSVGGVSSNGTALWEEFKLRAV